MNGLIDGQMMNEWMMDNEWMNAQMNENSIDEP